MHEPKQNEWATKIEIPLLEEEEGMTINFALEISTIHKGIVLFFRQLRTNRKKGNLQRKRKSQICRKQGTAEDSKFIEAWKKVMPNMDPPKTPSAYMAPRPPTPSTIPSKLTVNFVLSYNSVLSGKEVDMVIIPATTGHMGVY
ncbi:ATP synthase subunit delta' [Striga asiatica]|uniref:ATP synthase subunit delta n=1 Tax=Striga asiatica TaxID=4170 RepID=A0A5A7QIF3_STRAF|nr:ATP synthase subunit delta' [Striga asiatica]